MSSKQYAFREYPGVGMLGIGVQDDALTDLHFRTSHDWPGEYEEEETALHLEIFRQLEEYFSGARKAFDLPLAPSGTDFQLKCWNALLAIPYGQTRSYGDIARAVGSPKGFRAVGMANNRNPIAIIIPCHRVIGSDGKLVGFGGGLDVKAWLLGLEFAHAGN